MEHIVVGILLLPLIIYVPGWAFTQALLASDRLDGLELHLERCLISALWSGWLALLLGSLGIFSLWLHLGLTLIVTALLFWWAFRRARRVTAPLATSTALVWFATLLLLTLLVARPFEVILGVRDAGVYAVTGFAMARTGSIVQTDAVVAELGQAAQSTDPAIREPAAQAISNFMIAQARDRYIASRLRAAGFLINEGDLAQGGLCRKGFTSFRPGSGC